MGEPGGALRRFARGTRPGLGVLVRRREAPAPRGALGVHRLARDGRGLTLALDVLADPGSLPFRAASRGGVRPGARWGTPPGRTDVVRAVSGPPRPAAVRHSPVHADRLQASRRVGGALRHSRRLSIAPEGT